LRKRAIDAAREWLEERTAVPGGLGGIYPAMANSIVALRLLGYADDHPLVLGQLKEIEALAGERGDELYYQPCPSPIWDTSLAVNALIESDLAVDHPALVKAAEWMLSKQILVTGDWQVKRPHVQPGGWAFQYGNDFYPDLDDTAMVLMGLEKIRGVDADRVRWATGRGRAVGQGARGRLVPRHAERGRRLGLVRCRQRSPLSEQHSLRRPRGAARSLDRRPHRSRSRAARHARLSARSRGRRPRDPLH